MNSLSRPFILRHVATSLLMLATSTLLTACWHEQPVPPLHSPAGSHLAADAGLSDYRADRMAVAAGGGIAPGGLSHHSGIHLPARGGAQGHLAYHYRASGAASGADTRAQADVLHQLRRSLGDHPAVCSGGGSG